MGYNSVADNTGLSSFVYPLLAPQHSERIRTYSRSRSSKIIDLGVNRNRICDFPSTLSKHCAVCYTLTRKPSKRQVSARQPCVYKDLFCHLTVVWCPLAEERLAISTQSIRRWKVHLVGCNSVADNTGLSSLSVIASEIWEMYKCDKIPI